MTHERTLQEESLCTQIALGSITVLLVLCWMLAFMITESALADNAFRALHRDPGLEGLSTIVYIVPFYAWLPIYVYCVRNSGSRAFRWIAVVLAGLGIVFWALHHLSHWQFGQRPTFGSHVVDFTLHGVGLWLFISSIKWAKLPLAVRQVDRVPSARKAVLEGS